MEVQVLFVTATSSLTIRKFHDQQLLMRCIDECEHHLQVDPTIQVFGRVCVQHRNVGFFSSTSTGYKYSGQVASSKPLTPNLTELLSQVNMIFGAEYNGILVNKYKNGHDYISPHSDDEHNLDSKCGVVSASAGATRTFRIRDKITKSIVLDIPLHDCDIVCMSGNFQREYTHEVPQQKRITECRYSFTFRKHST